MRVGVGDTLEVLVNWITHESPHERVQANAKEGILIKLIRKKNPLVVPIKATAMALERKWIFGYPQLFSLKDRK